ncbi:MAG: diguanylate cyclase [Planctomycetes bacterium]|nr:diguanylate cyclase [Planctomycetota bacterium]
MLGKRLDELKMTGNLPSPTGVGLAILELTSREDYSLGDLARTLQTDPALTGRILRLANSSDKAGAQPAKTVHEAAMRLGVRTVRSVALGFSLVSGNRAGACAAFDYDDYWSRSLATAVAAQVLAEQLRTVVPPEAFTCGLLADIGRLALASIHPVAYAKVMTDVRGRSTDELAAAETRDFGLDHRELAGAMLADWKLPISFSFSVANFERREPEAAWPDDAAKHMTGILKAASRIGAACLLHRDEASTTTRMHWNALDESRQELGLSPQDFLRLCELVRASWRDWGSILKINTPNGPSFEEISRTAQEQRDEPVDRKVELLAARKGLRILAADDEPISLRLLVHHLTRDGHTVMTASNGREALSMALTHNPQMVVTDWMMPELDGVEVCKALRRSSEGVATYILILTGREEEDRVVEAFEAGADEYVNKPFNPRVLLARVRAGQRMIELREQVERDKQERARQLAEMAVLNRRLQTAALTDVLTELPNRRYAMKRLEQELATTRGTKQPLAVIMIDIDKFKLINDQHGHDIGDVVLRETANSLRKAVRRGDVVCRLGGEEFLVISPLSDLKRGELLAERIRKTVEESRIEHGSFSRNVTVSLGVASASDASQSLDGLLKEADRRVYHAKSLGRNRVCSSEPPTAESQAG